YVVLLFTCRDAFLPSFPLFFYCSCAPRDLHSFPTRRSSDLPEAARLTALQGANILLYPTAIGWHPAEKQQYGAQQLDAWTTIQRDRKSTRLNSSHDQISYAVFCLKKKKKKKHKTTETKLTKH